MHDICDVCGGLSTCARLCLCFKSQVRCCYCDAVRWAEETALSLRCWGLDGCQECGLKCVSARCSRVISTVHWAEHTVLARGHHYCRRVQERRGKCTWIWSTVGLQKQNPPSSFPFLCMPTCVFILHPEICCCQTETKYVDHIGHIVALRFLHSSILARWIKRRTWQTAVHPHYIFREWKAQKARDCSNWCISSACSKSDVLSQALADGRFLVLDLTPVFHYCSTDATSSYFS